MATLNTAQPVFGKSYGGTATENYERYFVPTIGGPLAADLVAEAALRVGERVLDVACGTGVVARLAAERVGAAGTVAGLDINPGMLAIAQVSAAGAHIRWYETSAESMPLPDNAFDVVFCQLGLQFIADKATTLREIQRVLAPGGRLLVSTPRPNPFFDVLDHALGRHVSPEAAAFVRLVFSLNDPAEVERLFRDAGMRAIAVRNDTKTLRLPPARDFLWQYVHSTPLTGLLPRDAECIAAIERDVVTGWQPWCTDDAMTCEQRIIVATARK